MRGSPRGRNAMKRNLVALLAIILSLTPVAVVAQRGAGGGGQRQGQGSAGAGGQRSGQGTMSQSRSRTQDQAQTMQRERLRKQATTQQRSQYRTCDQTMQQTRTMAGDMTRAAQGKAFNAEQARQQQQGLQEQVRVMQQNREQLMKGLSKDQQGAVQQRTRTLEQTHERIQNRLRNMEQELASSSPNQNRVAEEARLTEREMRSYQNEFRRVGDYLGLKNE